MIQVVLAVLTVLSSMAVTNSMEPKFQGLKEQLTQEMEVKFVAVDNKFVALDNKFVALDNKFVALENKVDNKFAAVDASIARLQASVDTLVNRQK